MRIISGSFKGRKLTSMKGSTTRPTSDRVRESIFNILASDITGSSVLDLFAGTGALGLEAISRGAASAVFIDSSESAVKIIHKNIIACKSENCARVTRWDINKNLNCLHSKTPAYDLVFMDPPYNKSFILPTLKKLVEQNTLKNGAMIIIEHSTAEALSEDIKELKLKMADQRRYGKTVVSFLTVMLEDCLSNNDFINNWNDE